VRQAHVRIAALTQARVELGVEVSLRAEQQTPDVLSLIVCV
jgi:hypothetical protein